MVEHNNSGFKKATMSDVKKIYKLLNAMRAEISKIFLGHNHAVDSLLIALLCDGHVLVEGVPGVAKTLLIKTLAKVSGCSFSRVQFTADLLPTDILGLTTYNPQTGFEIVKGPIFSNFIIADEINRSPPKTQSALIEAMQERQVTIGKNTFHLPRPFFVMASQNPLETEGVFSLPEAQIDRFLFKILISYPEEDTEKEIMDHNVTSKKFEDYDIKSIVSDTDILEMQKLNGFIYLDPKIKSYIMELIKKTRNKDFKMGDYIELGGSPRATIAVSMAAKSRAMINGRNYVTPADIKLVIKDVLRHRLILSYKARAEGVTADDVMDEILKVVPVP